MYISMREKIYNGPSKLLVKEPSPYLLPIMIMHLTMKVVDGNTAINAYMYCFRHLGMVVLFY